MKLLVVSCFLAAAFAGPQNYYQNQGQYRQYQYQPQPQPQPQYPYVQKQFVPIVSETNDIGTDGSFSYSYVTGDGQQAQAQGYLKNVGYKDQEVEVIQGSYSYTAPDGTPITVTYIADENGFRAEGAHLPTPPPVPEAIQKSLAYIAQAQRSVPQQAYNQRYQREAKKTKE